MTMQNVDSNILSNLVVHEVNPSAGYAEAVVTSFFEELSSTQGSLGYEFEQVLFENIWDLYQS